MTAIAREGITGQGKLGVNDGEQKFYNMGTLILIYTTGWSGHMNSQSDHGCRRKKAFQLEGPSTAEDGLGKHQPGAS